MKKETETLQMLDDTESSDSVAGTGPAVYAPDMGQMFDEFFNFAAEIERDVLGQGGSSSVYGAQPSIESSPSSSRSLWRGAKAKGSPDSKSQLYELFGNNIQQV